MLKLVSALGDSAKYDEALRQWVTAVIAELDRQDSMLHRVVKWAAILGVGATTILWVMIWVAVQWERMVRPNDDLSEFGDYWLPTRLTLGGGALLGVLVGVLVECSPRKKRQRDHLSETN